ncbi:MAG: hypothetical protein ACP5M0_01885 [Desulfomonilaceae bacterium]
MGDQELKELIAEKQKEQRIACKTALQIAETAGVSPRKVGELLNEMKIKIHSCQLGCFQ